MPRIYLIDATSAILDQCHHSSKPDKTLDLLRCPEILHVGRESLIQQDPNSDPYNLVKILAVQTGSLIICNIQSEPEEAFEGIRHIQVWQFGFLITFDTEWGSFQELSKRYPRISFGEEIIPTLDDGRRNTESLDSAIASALGSGDESVIQCYLYFIESHDLTVPDIENRCCTQPLLPANVVVNSIMEMASLVACVVFIAECTKSSCLKE